MPAPSNIVLSSSTVCAGMPNGTVVADITISGISACTGYVLTLTSNYGGAFALSGNDSTGYQLLVSNTLLLAPNSYAAITLQVVDDLGNSLIQSFFIQILDCTGFAPILTRLVPSASKVGTTPYTTIYGNYLALGGAPILTIDGKIIPLISYTNTEINFAMTNLPAGRYDAVVTNGNLLTGSLPFFRYTSDVGPDQNIGNIYCTSKPSMSLVFDTDGPGGKYGATMIVTPPNPNMQYLQVYLKYNYTFDWQTGGEVTLDNIKLQAGDLVYLSAQQVPTQDGVYTVTAGPWIFYEAVTPNVFIDLGARSYDIIDGNITREIITDMGVNFGIPGVYQITYYSMNSLNILSFVVRQVNVLAQETIDVGGINGNPPGTTVIVTGSLSPTNGFWITDYQITPTFDSELINELLLSNSFFTPRCAADMIAGGIGGLPIQDIGVYIRRDGLTVFIANQSMGGHRLIQGAAGSSPGDSIILQQLASLLEYVPTIITQYTAGETIAALQVVYIGATGKIFISSNTNPLCINTTMGIAISNANANDPILICCTGTINGFSGLSTAKNYWLGTNGSLVINEPPITGFELMLGVATQPTMFLLMSQLPIIG